MSDLIVGFTGNLLAVVVAIGLWGGHRERPEWMWSFHALLGVLVLNVSGWLVVLS